MTREEVADVVRRRLPLFLACLVIAPAAAVAAALAGPEPDYRATASLLDRPLPTDAQLFPSLTPDSPYTPRETLAITEAVVAADVAKRSPGDAAEIEESVTTTVRTGEDVVHVTIDAGDPDRAAALRLANAYASAYARLRAETDTRRLRNAILSLQDNLRAGTEPGREGLIRRRLAQLRELHDLRRTRVRAVEPATSATRESREVGRKAAIGLVLGLLVALASTFLLEQLDRRIRSRSEAERILGAPALAVPVALERIRASESAGRVVVASDADGRLASELRAHAESAGYALDVLEGSDDPRRDGAGALVAVDLRRTTRAEAEAVRDRLAASDTPLIGIVIDP